MNFDLFQKTIKLFEYFFFSSVFFINRSCEAIDLHLKLLYLLFLDLIKTIKLSIIKKKNESFSLQCLVYCILFDQSLIDFI